MGTFNSSSYSTKISLYNLIKLINVSLIIIYFAWYITPIFRAYFYGGINNFIIIGIIFVWFLTSFIINPNWIVNLHFNLVIVTIQIIIFIILALSDIGHNASSHMYLAISFWFTIYIFHFYKFMKWYKVIGKIGTILLLILLITSITTMIGLINTPNASRILTSSSSEIDDVILYSKNIGGFDFIYGIIILVPLFISFLVKNNQTNLIIKVFFTLILLTSILVVANASFTIAILTIVLSIILGLLSKLKYRYIIPLFFVLLILSFLIPNTIISDLFYNLAQLINTDYVSNRLYDISNYLSGSINSTNDLGIRIFLYKLSLETFINNPLGIGPYYYSDGVGIGNHSQILDDLARYGIFGLMYYILFFSSYFIYIRRIYLSQKLNINFSNSLLIFLFISLLNPTFSSQTISVILFFILPSLPFVIRYLNKSID